MKRDPLTSVMPSAMPLARDASAWRIALTALALALVFIVVAFFGTASAMVGIWARSETFTHGFVVAPISLWLIWRMRERLRAFTPRPSWIALPPLAAAGFAWLLGDVGAVNSVAQAAFVAMLVLAVPTVLGIPVTRAMLFPLGFLFFSVPIGEFLLPTLMSHTADFTVFALRASGVPVYREGFQLVIPTGRWSIVEACSGVRYLIASLMVGTLFAYLNYRTLWRRYAFIGVAIAVPIVANWIRAYMIVMLGHLSNNRIATGVDHIIYGWLFFGIVMLVMFWIGARWQEPAAALGLPARRVSRDVTDAAATPIHLWGAAIAVMAVAVVWPVADYVMERGAADPSATLRAIEVPAWQATAAGDASFTPHFVDPSAVRHEIVRRGDSEVGLYVAYYRGQNAQHKLVSSDNVLVRSEDHVWHTIASAARSVTIGGAPVAVATARIKGTNGQTIEARQWYWIGGALTSSDAIAKARIAWSLITGRGDDSAVIVVYTPVIEGSDPDATLDAFTRDAWPAIASALANARAHS